MKYLIDTNVLSEWSKPAPNESVISWLKSLDELNISSVSLFEIRYGLLLKKSDYKNRWFSILEPALTILKPWPEIFENGLTLFERCKKKGIHPEPFDMLIAATAKHFDCVLATRNEKDFKHCGIDVFNPFA